MHRAALTERRNDNDVATVLDTSFEKLSFVLSRTMGATAAGLPI
jgi:hypothetical protein